MDFPLVLLQGNQEVTAPPEAMAQPYPPAQYPTPQNGIPAEYAPAHPHPTQDYAGQTTVPEHAMTIYTPTQTHSDQPCTDANTQSLTGTSTVPVSMPSFNLQPVHQRCRENTTKSWRYSADQAAPLEGNRHFGDILGYVKKGQLFHSSH